MMRSRTLTWTLGLAVALGLSLDAVAKTKEEKAAEKRAKEEAQRASEERERSWDEQKQLKPVMDQAKAAFDSGDIEPERDLAPLVLALRTAKYSDTIDHLISLIVDIGEEEASSPAAVKHYLLDQCTPRFFEIAKDTSLGPFARGSAVTAVSRMGAPRKVVEEMVEIALQAEDKFVQSRGEIIENHLKSDTQETSELDAIHPKDPQKERQAIALLKSRRIGVSMDALRRMASESKAEEAQALLDAGVDVNFGAQQESPLMRAVTACSYAQGESDAIVQTVNVLIAGGADVKRADELNNTVLAWAAGACGTKVLGALVAAGADVNASNQMGLHPVTSALIRQKYDNAEFLISKGSRLNAEQAQMVSADDARAKEIVKKARKR